MLHHIVTWKIKDFAEGKSKEENIKLLFEGYENLKKQIPSIQTAKMFKGNGKTGNEDVILVTEFPDENTLNEYISHPAHIEYSKFCKAVRQSRSAIDYID